MKLTGLAQLTPTNYRIVELLSIKKLFSFKTLTICGVFKYI